ncbi:MAG TPA: threonine--tRNA ligase [Catenuloplanes sp.]|jgi:threonyl-tRNA synthetase
MIDHRVLGRELELFCSDPLAGAGLPIWLPDGAAARHQIEGYVREEERRAGYHHVYSPPLGRRELYELSGHLEHFAEDMFPPMRLSRPAAEPAPGAEDGAADVGDPGVGDPGVGDDELLLRPSLCPHHALVFRSRGRSYRELPLRVGELGAMFRAERSGVLGGLSRVRAISLNDAHIFCAPDQVAAEVAGVLALIRRAHAALGVRAAGFRLSLRGPGDGFVADPPMWDRAEGLLRQALVAAGVPFVEAPGEAAFYGPKIDVQIRDRLGREQTLSTIQLDYAKPERFGLSYVDADGSRRRPVMVHRSVVGSMERLFAHLIEVHAGAFPVWYAPVQLEVLPIGAAQPADAFARAAVEAGLRVRVSERGSLAARVRDSVRRRVPYVAVFGDREAADGRVSLRLRDGRSLDPLPLSAALALIGRVVASRSPELLPPAGPAGDPAAALS